MAATQTNDLVTSGITAVASTTTANVTMITYAAPNLTGTLQIDVEVQVNDGTLYDRFKVSYLVKVVAGTPTSVGNTVLATKITAIIALAPVANISGSNVLIQTAQTQSGNLSWWAQARCIFSGT